MTKVSVIIPTYNRPELVSKAIESVLNQTHSDIEIIVVDDGDRESAESAVKKFTDSRISYLKHPNQKGCSAAKNTGINSAKGQFIAFLDDDDTFFPDKIATQVELLEGSSNDVGFSFTGSLEIYDDREYKKPVPEGLSDYHELTLRNFSTMIDSAMMYKREVFDTVGLLDESFPTHTGAEFAIRVAREFKGVGINQPLVRRLMINDHLQMGSNVQKRIKGRIMLLERYADDFRKHPPILAKHLERLAKFYRTEEDYTNARRYFWEAFTLQPRLIRFLHYCSMICSGLLYRTFRFFKLIEL